MDKIKGVAKGGYHPKGKEGGTESWRGDFKGINTVVRLTESSYFSYFSIIVTLADALMNRLVGLVTAKAQMHQATVNSINLGPLPL